MENKSLNKQKSVRQQAGWYNIIYRPRKVQSDFQASAPTRTLSLHHTPPYHHSFLSILKTNPESKTAFFKKDDLMAYRIKPG